MNNVVFYLDVVDLKSALGKKRRNGRNVLPQPLIHYKENGFYL